MSIKETIEVLKAILKQYGDLETAGVYEHTDIYSLHNYFQFEVVQPDEGGTEPLCVFMPQECNHGPHLKVVQ